MMYSKSIKPCLDVLAACVVFLLLLPVFLLLTLCLGFANHGQVFFLQDRVGFGDKIFRIIKFKTMNEARDINGQLLSDADRLTPIGKFVRQTSLDEIPQLINVLKGDMSLVGPRPLLPEYLSLYNEEQKKRHLVKPGITGLTQVSGRNALSWKDKFKFDVQYVNQQSFRLDLKILYLTFKKVVKSEGINEEGQATTTYFKGND